jgi:hypothetical protein
MTCPRLERFRQQRPLPAHFKDELDLVYSIPGLRKTLHDILFAVHNAPYNTRQHQHQMGEALYFLVGSALAARQEWNKMTFLQLEHEARVQGLLGPFERHQHTAWKLRLKLACEARMIENEKNYISEDVVSLPPSTS